MPKRAQRVGASRQNSVAYSPDPIPPETRVTLSYQDIVSPTAALNTWARQYRLTSLFDPDASGVGNQPLSYDEWMRLYLNYRVESCSYTLETSCRTANGQMSLAAAPYGGGTVITDPEVIATLPMATTGSTMNGASPCVLRGKIHASKVYGVPKNAIATNEQFWGTASTNPTLETILNIAATTSGATDVSTYKIVLKFKVTFFRPGLVLLSLSRAPRSLCGTAATAPLPPSTITVGEPSPGSVGSIASNGHTVVGAARAGGTAPCVRRCPSDQPRPQPLSTGDRDSRCPEGCLAEAMSGGPRLCACLRAGNL